MALHTLSMLVDDGHNVKRLSEAGWSLDQLGATNATLTQHRFRFLFHIISSIGELQAPVPDDGG